MYAVRVRSALRLQSEAGRARPARSLTAAPQSASGWARSTASSSTTTAQMRRPSSAPVSCRDGCGSNVGLHLHACAAPNLPANPCVWTVLRRVLCSSCCLCRNLPVFLVSPNPFCTVQTDHLACTVRRGGISGCLPVQGRCSGDHQQQVRSHRLLGTLRVLLKRVLGRFCRNVELAAK